MNEEKEFIKSKIKELNDQFGNATFKYEFKELSDIHFIQVMPKYVFESEKFLLRDLEITEEFEQFGSQNTICFISDKALTELDNPEILTFESYFSSEGSTNPISIDYKGFETESITPGHENFLVSAA